MPICLSLVHRIGCILCDACIFIQFNIITKNCYITSVKNHPKQLCSKTKRQPEICVNSFYSRWLLKHFLSFKKLFMAIFRFFSVIFAAYIVYNVHVFFLKTHRCSNLCLSLGEQILTGKMRFVENSVLCERQCVLCAVYVMMFLFCCCCLYYYYAVIVCVI